MSITKNIDSFKDKLNPYNCKLVAVSKKKPIEDILEAYNAGHRDFGENKVQELMDKMPQLPSDIRWHMIGHLQRNKVKFLVPSVYMIHSVDSIRLLSEIEKQASNAGTKVSCLLQVHIAKEETKFGFNEEEIFALLASDIIKELRWVNILGLMGMATFTEDMDLIRREFHGLKAMFNTIKATNYPACIDMQELSIGMTNDYETALEEGSTMIRIGSAIFGPRE